MIDGLSVADSGVSFCSAPVWRDLPRGPPWLSLLANARLIAVDDLVQYHEIRSGQSRLH